MTIHYNVRSLIPIEMPTITAANNGRIFAVQHSQANMLEDKMNFTASNKQVCMMVSACMKHYMHSYIYLHIP